MMKPIEWNGEAALSLETGGIRLIAPIGFGPRLLFFGLSDGPNLLHLMKDEEGSGPGGDYFFRGGHRLWHAPEDPVRTYQPDNDKLEWSKVEGGFRLLAPVESETGLRKEVECSVERERTFRIVHRISNHGLWPVEFAPWALTVLRAGGRAVLPLLPKGEHPRDLLPRSSVVPWPYSDLSLPCWRWEPSFLGLEVAKVPGPQKVGFTDWPGWLGYWNDGASFVKYVRTEAKAAYPDLGCKMEVFSNGGMVELETLGALRSFAPGETAEHVEYWTILEGLPAPVDEDSVDRSWQKPVQEWIASLPGGESR
jgi:hypothetical protein